MLSSTSDNLGVVRSPTVTFLLRDAAATARLGRLLGERLQPGQVVALIGDLGAGKTCLAKAVIAAQGAVDEDDVISPTFVLAREYPGRVQTLHLDAYRLEGGGDLETLGFELTRPGQRAVLVEWADRVLDALPQDRMTITLEHDSGGRLATLTAQGPASQEQLTGLLEDLSDAGIPAASDRT